MVLSTDRSEPSYLLTFVDEKIIPLDLWRGSFPYSYPSRKRKATFEKLLSALKTSGKLNPNQPFTAKENWKDNSFTKKKQNNYNSTS